MPSAAGPDQKKCVVEDYTTELCLQAQLEGGEWVHLLGPGHPGIAEVKWCANRFTPFLCIGPSPAVTAGKMDAEEFIEVCSCLHSDVHKLR